MALARLVVLLVALSGVAAGCALDGQIAVRFSGTSPVVVAETAKPEQIPHRVEGVTKRNGQIVRIACSITMLYDVREATGSAVLAQQYVARLRTRRLRRGTPYRLDCMGPLIVELPADAFGVGATSTNASGLQAALSTQARVRSVPVAFGRRLRAEPRMQLALVEWPRAFPAGDYQVELAFSLPQVRTIREKAVYTASVTCGRSTYLQPLLPAVHKMARAPALTIRPSADPIAFPLPRLVGGIGTYAEASRTLSCTR